MKQKQSSGARFWKGYIIFTAVLLIFVAAGLGVFYDFIRAYELSQPEHAAEEFVRSFDDDQLAEWIREEAASLPLTYESADIAAQALISKASGLERVYSWQREYGTSSDVPVFRLMREEVWVGCFSLNESKDGKYGFSTWSADSGNAVLDALAEETAAYTVYAPADAIVYVNGIEVLQKDCVSQNAVYPYLHSMDKKDAIRAAVYSVNGLFEEPAITCIRNGEVCEGETTDGIMRFRVPEEQFPQYIIRAPHGSEITVNGHPLTDDYRTEAQTPYSYHTLEAGMNGLPTEDVYSLSVLLTKPEVRVRFNRTELEVIAQESSFTAEYPSSMRYSSEILVPQGSELSVRGISCKDFFKGETASAYPELYDDRVSAPLYEVYRFDSLYLPLSDIVVAYGGETLSFTEQNGFFSQHVSAEYPEYEDEDVHRLALGFARDYVQYVAYGYNNTAVNLANALRHVRQGSDLYTRIQRSKIGIDFVTPVSSQKFNRLEIREMRRVSENDVYCTIEFDIDQFIYRVHRKYTGTMELNCYWNGSQWSVDEMRISTEE